MLRTLTLELGDYSNALQEGRYLLVAVDTDKNTADFQGTSTQLLELIRAVESDLWIRHGLVAEIH